MAAACLFTYTYAITVVITYLALSVIASIWCFTGYKNLIACAFNFLMCNRYAIQCPQFPTYVHHSTRSSHILHTFQHTACMITGHHVVFLNISICNYNRKTCCLSSMSANRYSSLLLVLSAPVTDEG